MAHTVDGRNPANQLRLVVYPFIPLFLEFYTCLHQQYDQQEKPQEIPSLKLT